MIDEKNKAMILEALNDEYKAGAFYRLMIKTFGPIQPFVHIVETEETHARALERVTSLVEEGDGTFPGIKMCSV